MGVSIIIIIINLIIFIIIMTSKKSSKHGLSKFTKLTWFNLARFSTCEDLIKEYKYDNVPNKESSFKNISSYLEFMKSVKIGTGPLYGHFKIIHLWSDIQYMYIDIYK